MNNPMLRTQAGQVRMMQELIRAERAQGYDALHAFDRVTRSGGFSDEVCRGVIKAGFKRTAPRPQRDNKK